MDRTCEELTSRNDDASASGFAACSDRIVYRFAIVERSASLCTKLQNAEVAFTKCRWLDAGEDLWVFGCPRIIVMGKRKPWEQGDAGRSQ
jgi:hypothetical protein